MSFTPPLHLRPPPRPARGSGLRRLAHHADWVATLVAAAGGVLNDTVLPAPDSVNLFAGMASSNTSVEGPRRHVLLNVDQTNQVTLNDPGGCGPTSACFRPPGRLAAAAPFPPPPSSASSSSASASFRLPMCLALPWHSAFGRSLGRAWNSPPDRKRVPPAEGGGDGGCPWQRVPMCNVACRVKIEF